MWYNGSWSFRHPFSVWRSGAGGAVDVNIAIPSWWDEFWEQVDADGDDIRITAADGYTELSWQLSGWNSTTRTGTIQIDNMTLVQQRLELGWIYWGNAGAAAVTPSGHTPASPVIGSIYVGAPGPTRVEARRLDPGNVSPPQVVGKLDGVQPSGSASADQLVIWWRLTDLLAGSWGRLLRGRPYHDEWAYAYEASGFSGLYDAGSWEAKTDPYEYFILGQGQYAYQSGDLWVSTTIDGVATADDLIVRLVGGIVSPRGSGTHVTTTYTAPVILRARAPSEA